jgi:hypothetical protein
MRRAVFVFLAATLLSATTALAGPIMYVHDGGGNLGTVDVATGAATVIGNMGVVMTDIAFDPLGNLYGISFDNLYSINSSTAAASLIGATSIAGGNALVFGADGTLYGAGFATTNLFTINPLTGASSVVGNMGFASGGDLAFNTGDFYLASSGAQLIRVNPTTGAGALVGAFGVAGVFGLATGDDGVLYAVAGTNVYTVNTATGAATNPVNFGGQGLGVAFGQSFVAETQVPEPALILLLGGGVAAALRRRAARS